MFDSFLYKWKSDDKSSDSISDYKPVPFYQLLNMFM